MPTVGDVIFSTRSRIPDMPQTMPAPVMFSAVTATGGSLANGNYVVVATQFNIWGETIASGELSVTLSGVNNAILMSIGAATGVVKIRVYLGFSNVAGSEIAYQDFTPNLLVDPAPYTFTAPTGNATPPTFSSAYNFDTDGTQFSAAIVYRWMNEGLNAFTRTVGGVLDYSGVPTVAGQSMYVLPGEWIEVSDIWYGGYWVQGGKRSQYFRRNTVTSAILHAATVSVFTDKQVLEVSYQPDRTAGATVTTANMSVTDASVPISNTGVFLLPFGFCQIGTEICAYASLASGQISGLIRGLGSTVAAAWTSGTPVTELSLFWCGKRVTFNPLTVGSSLADIPFPQGWTAILPEYMLAQAKKSERDMAAADALEKNFYALAEKWLVANRPPQRFVQVGGISRPFVFNQILGQGVIVP